MRNNQVFAAVRIHRNNVSDLSVAVDLSNIVKLTSSAADYCEKVAIAVSASLTNTWLHDMPTNVNQNSILKATPI